MCAPVDPLTSAIIIKFNTPSNIHRKCTCI